MEGKVGPEKTTNWPWESIQFGQCPLAQKKGYTRKNTLSDHLILTVICQSINPMDTKPRKLPN